jgi:GT2 family glycosyltransferase
MAAERPGTSASGKAGRGPTDHPNVDASIVVALQGDPAQALRCLAGLAELPAHPTFEVIVVDDASAGLEDILARLDGDVAVVRSQERAGAAAALALGLARCTADHVVLLRGAPAVGPGFLPPLLAALADPAVAAATSVGADGAEASPVAARALAARRVDLPALPAAPDGLELAAVVAALARRGEVVPVPASVVAGPRERAVAARSFGGSPEVSIVIPTLDAASERVRACVAAVQATVDAPHEIVVIDNGSPPQGFTAPVNAGLRAARGAYAVVMNDDVEPLPGWWAPLRAGLDAGAAVVFPETIDGAMRHDFAAWCFALSRATLDEFAVAPGEFLDPELVVWYQDTDLLERLRRAGRPPEFVPASRIRHALSQTVASDDRDLRAWVSRQVLADKAAFEAKHGTGVAGAAA